MLSVAEAGSRILAQVRERSAHLRTETVPLREARGRILAAPLQATRSLPPWDNSAMDGFAVRAADLAGAPVELPIAGVIAAGDRQGRALAAGTALRIMTGAPLPRGADCVVMREDAEDRGDRVGFREPARTGQHVRRAGEDVAAGATVLEAGCRLGPGELAMLAAQGRAGAEVAARPRVVILSTGDELCQVGETPAPGQIFSSNEHALAAQADEAGAEVLRTELVPDERARIDAALAAALADADVVVTSGGVSVGDFDHVKDALAGAGLVLDFWKVAMKPGKPVAFAAAPDLGPLCFGLPGNPVSSMVSFELFVRPALLALQGAARIERPRAQVVLARAVEKQPGRAHYLRAQLRRDGARLEAVPHPRQGSGMVSSLVGVDALVELAAEMGDQPAGARVPALLLRAV